MKRILIIIGLVLTLSSNSSASDLFFGALTSQEELQFKIAQIKELIFYNYQRSGLRTWAPFMYWKSKANGEYLYCYTLLPLGRVDRELLRKMEGAAIEGDGKPVYIPVKINRAGSMRS